MTNGSGNGPNDTEAAQAKLRAAKRKLLEAKLLLDNEDYYSGLSDEDKAKAVETSLTLSTKILEIENAQISAIVEKVKVNADALDAATDELADTLDDVQNFTKVLSAVTALLGLVTRILAV